ncbi:MAG: hypothetical protein WC933_02470 [Candidatus Paceibacterota bacterium]|jgi:hypothetical protein
MGFSFTGALGAVLFIFFIVYSFDWLNTLPFWKQILLILCLMVSYATIAALVVFFIKKLKTDFLIKKHLDDTHGVRNSFEEDEKKLAMRIGTKEEVDKIINKRLRSKKIF